MQHEGMPVRSIILVALVFAVQLDRSSADDTKGPLPNEEVVTKFLTEYNNTPPAKRLKFAMDPDVYEKGQERQYKGQPNVKDQKTVVTSIKKGPKADYLTVEADMSGLLNGREISASTSWYLVNTKDGLKIDWGANHGYNPVVYKAWAAGEDEKLTVRIVAKLDENKSKGSGLLCRKPSS